MEGEGIINKTVSVLDGYIHDLIVPHYLITALLIVILLVLIYHCWKGSESMVPNKPWSMAQTGKFQDISASMEGMDNKGVPVAQIYPGEVGRSQVGNPYAVYTDPALQCTSGDVLLDGDDPYAYTLNVLQTEVAQGKTEGLRSAPLLTGQEVQTMNRK